MKNPWTEFHNNPKVDYLILDADKAVVDKINGKADDRFRMKGKQQLLYYEEKNHGLKLFHY